MNQDDEQLRLLAIFHYVVAGLAGLFSLFPLLHLAMGLFMIFDADNFTGKGGPPPAWFGWFLVIIASGFILIGLTMAALILTAGRFLSRRKHHTFCLVVGAVECLFMPFGTVLGIFTIITLNRASVKQLFAGANPPRG
jgi:hypothetical protein